MLDDATSAVDPTVEAGIHATLRRLMADRTTIVIAHRRSTISLADRIVVVDGRPGPGRGHPRRADGVVPPLRRTPHRGAARRRRGSPARRRPPRAAVTGRRAATARRWPASGVWSPPAGRRRGSLGRAAPVRGRRPTAGISHWPGRCRPTRSSWPRWRPSRRPMTNRESTPRRPPDRTRTSRSDGSCGRSGGCWPSGSALVAVDALAGLAGPALVRAGVARGVEQGSAAGLTAATVAFAAVVLDRLVGPVGRGPVDGAPVRAAALLVAAQGLRPPEPAGARLLRAGDGRADPHPHDQRHRGPVPALPAGDRQPGGQRPHRRRGGGRAVRARLAPGAGRPVRRAAAAGAHRVVPAELRPGLPPHPGQGRRSSWPACRRACPAPGSWPPSPGKTATSRSSGPCPANTSTPASTGTACRPRTSRPSSSSARWPPRWSSPTAPA